jgi:hypothetical protein
MRKYDIQQVGTPVTVNHSKKANSSDLAPLLDPLADLTGQCMVHETLDGYMDQDFRFLIALAPPCK